VPPSGLRAISQNRGFWQNKARRPHSWTRGTARHKPFRNSFKLAGLDVRPEGNAGMTRFIASEEPREIRRALRLSAHVKPDSGERSGKAFTAPLRSYEISATWSSGRRTHESDG
jgi:hypothetical protein